MCTVLYLLLVRAATLAEVSAANLPWGPNPSLPVLSAFCRWVRRTVPVTLTTPYITSIPLFLLLPPFRRSLRDEPSSSLAVHSISRGRLA